jgi:hypothetical protein
MPEATGALVAATGDLVPTTLVEMPVEELRTEHLVMDGLLGILVLILGDGKFLDEETDGDGDGNGIQLTGYAL